MTGCQTYNRDLKFRFFNTARFGMLENKCFPVLKISFEHGYVHLPGGYSRNFNEGYLMQYTGIKDKNGKEIYEGDILKDVSGNLQEVQFDTGTFILHNPQDEFQPRCGFYCSTNCEVYDGEVIGNIYENPELLGVSE